MFRVIAGLISGKNRDSDNCNLDTRLVISASPLRIASRGFRDYGLRNFTGAFLQNGVARFQARKLNNSRTKGDASENERYE